MGFNKDDSPIEYRTIITDSGESYSNRILIGIPATGLVRMEWVQSRVGQMIPPNWSMVTMTQMMSSFIPLRYQVADAQNIIVTHAVKNDFQWLLLWEHDTILPPDGIIRFNEWMRKEDTPVVSGLYYTRSHPTEPLVYRGRGTSCYTNWQPSDVVWCDGVPTGCLLIHVGLLKALWEDSEEYQAGPHTVRRVFETPMRLYEDPETGNYRTINGTSDLEWCSRVMSGGYFTKAGWPQYEGNPYPFAVDTNIFCGHINPDGSIFPQTSWIYARMEEEKRQRDNEAARQTAPEGEKEPVYFE